MKERIISRNVSHQKFRKRIKRLYNRGHITKENYEYLMFQHSIYEDCGKSLEAWKYINLETHKKFQEINEDSVSAIIHEWTY